MTQSAAALLKQSEYARHRHCSREAVRNAIASGRITTFGPDKLIDPELADAQWQRNTRVRVRTGTSAHTPTRSEATAPSDLTSYDEARRRRESAEAEIAQLRLAEMRGSLLRADDVTRHLAAKISIMREVFLQIPSRLVPILATETDANKIHTLLEGEIIAAMSLVNERKIHDCN